VLRPRIIPCLLVKNGGLVKTVGFAHPKYVGDPINAVKIFNEKEADELVVLDVDATATGAEPDFKRIGHLAVECRMPLCYGGGIKTADQARRIIGLGVEKVAISSAAIEHPQLITQIAQAIGNQSVVVVVDVKKARAILATAAPGTALSEYASKQVLRAYGIEPSRHEWVRPAPVLEGPALAAYVGFTRRRLCLPVEREPEIAAYVAEHPPRGRPSVVLWWDV